MVVYKYVGLKVPEGLASNLGARGRRRAMMVRTTYASPRV